MLGSLKGFNNFLSIVCGSRGSIVVVVTGCSRGSGVADLLFCFTFGNVFMLISIYFVLLPVNREARVKVVHPLARGGID
jgi:hypothetical protein